MKMIWVTVVVIFVSCGGRQGGEAAVAADKVWDNFRQYTISEDRRVETQADEAFVFTDDDKTLMKRVRLNQYGVDGRIEFKGVADEIEAKGNGDGFARGNIVVEDVVEGVIMEAEYLDWNSDDRMLAGNGRVTVDLGDGLKIGGEGFEADVARKSYKFASNVEGTLLVKTEEEKEQERKDKERNDKREPGEKGIEIDQITENIEEAEELSVPEPHEESLISSDGKEDEFDKFAK